LQKEANHNNNDADHQEDFHKNGNNGKETIIENKDNDN